MGLDADFNGGGDWLVEFNTTRLAEIDVTRLVRIHALIGQDNMVFLLGQDCRHVVD
jgi:hypothetical protein